MLLRTHPQRRQGGVRRGYSMIELAVSLGIFLVLASVISLAVAQSMVSQATVRTDRVVSTALENTLQGLAQGSYDDFLSNSFEPASPCSDTVGMVGTNAQSCLEISNRNYRVRYDVTVGADTVVSTGSNGSYVNVTATVQLANGKTVQAVRRVDAPTVGYAPGAGVVRLTLSGDYADLTSPLHLLSGSASPSSLVSAKRQGNIVLFRTDADNCTRALPCSIGLSAGNNSGESGELGILAEDALSQSIVLTEGGLVESSGRIFKKGTATVSLRAQSDTPAVSGTNPSAGSVCMWATFSDGAATRSVPLCNTGATPGQITLRDYAPRADQPSRRMPFPVNVPVKLSLDHPNGTCPRVEGMTGHTATGWVPAAVCSSWTWGVPSTFGPTDGTSAPFRDATLTLRSGQVDTYQVTWSGDQARPATGYGNQSVWAKPRQSAGCAFDGTCVPLNEAPETSECPNQHCLSVANAAPTLTSPSQGSQKVATIPASSSTTSFSVSAADIDGDPVSITLQTLPSSGTMHASANGTGPALTANTVVAPSGPSPRSVTLSYQNPPGQISLKTFTLLLSDGKPGGTRTVEVGLYHNTQPWEVRSRETTVAQGASTPLKVQVVATNGEFLPATPVTFTGAPAGASLSAASATTGATGEAEVTLNGGTAAAGSRTLTATATNGNRTGSIPVKVTAVSGTLDLVALGANQGGAGSLTVQAKDRAGNPMGGVAATLAVLQGGAASDTVYPEYSGCVTQSSGTCLVSVIIEPTAAAGTYAARAQSGNVVVNKDFSVTSQVSKVTLETTSIGQGETRDVTLVVLDGAGAPMAGVPLGLSSTDVQLSVPSATTTSGNGKATVPVSVAAGRAAGSAPLQATSGTQTYPLSITVTPVAGSLSAGPSASLAQGGSTSTWVTVLDRTGNPMSGARVIYSVPASSGLQITSRATSGANGQAATSVSASATAASASGVITATLQDTTTTVTIPYTVKSAPASLTIQGGVTGPTSTFQLTLRDGGGTGVTNQAVELVSPVTGLTLRGLAPRTDAEGRLQVEATQSGVPAGTYNLVVKVGGVSLTAPLTIS